jgi:hypothetical protein
MADETKKTYPRLSAKSWWTLRKKFNTKIPTVVDSAYLATSLSMGKDSARNNILPFLKTIGLVDSEGKPKDLAKRWRDDKDYPKVCAEILESVYPKTLLEAAPDPSKNRDDVKRWFKSEIGAGESAANKMTAFFTLLQEADVEGEKKIQETTTKPLVAKSGKRERKEKPPANVDAKEKELDESREQGIGQFPEIHVNVQIHVSADTTTDQVDHLFASIAKHLKEFNTRKPK